MGEYRDGKWVPTFGDDQFGVVDHPGERHEDTVTIQRQAQRIESLEAKLAAAQADSADLVWMDKHGARILHWDCKWWVTTDKGEGFDTLREAIAAAKGESE